MSRKDTITALFTQKKTAVPASVNTLTTEAERIKSGAISAMGTSLQQLSDGARNAAKLQDQIEEGTVIVNLDPDLIDSGMIADRLHFAIDPSFDELVESIRSSGQQVPILVRQLEGKPYQYQVAYGHRRLRAARRLGIKIKAIVRPLTDAEMVIAQGKENLERKDLSYIEKAIFARRLEAAGFERSTIMAALSTDKADLSRYISVARLIPDELVQAIGPADRIGRARWLSLAENLKSPDAPHRLQAVLGSEMFRKADSNKRFAQVFAALVNKATAEKSDGQIWRDPAGRAVVRSEVRKDQTTFIIDEAIAPSFGDFLANEMARLYERFRQEAMENSD